MRLITILFVACETGAALLIELFQVGNCNHHHHLIVTISISIIIFISVVISTIRIIFNLLLFKAGIPLWEVEVAVTSLCIALQV